MCSFLTLKQNAGSFSDCHNNGKFESCNMAENSCMLELRRSGNNVRISTGCMPQTVSTAKVFSQDMLSNQGCESQKRQNFVGPQLWRTQCRPENSRLWSSRFGESVCRTCFNICDSQNDAAKCLSTVTSFGIPLYTSPTETYWNPLTVTDRNDWNTDLIATQNANLLGIKETAHFFDHAIFET